MTQTENTSPTTRKTPQMIAFVTKNLPDAATSDQTEYEMITANTKRELKTKLSDPSVRKVITLIRGRVVPFDETRSITF